MCTDRAPGRDRSTRYRQDRECTPCFMLTANCQSWGAKTAPSASRLRYSRLAPRGETCDHYGHRLRHCLHHQDAGLRYQVEIVGDKLQFRGYLINPYFAPETANLRRHGRTKRRSKSVSMRGSRSFTTNFAMLECQVLDIVRRIPSAKIESEIL